MAVPTPRVLVRTMGVSSVPSSSTCVEPASLPKALPTKTPAPTFSWKTFPACGTTAVTPVRTVSPSIRVTWPTRTPATSVMASRAPGGKTPGASPRSRARGHAASSPGADAGYDAAKHTTGRRLGRATQRGRGSSARRRGRESFQGPRAEGGDLRLLGERGVDEGGALEGPPQESHFQRAQLHAHAVTHALDVHHRPPTLSLPT